MHARIQQAGNRFIIIFKKYNVKSLVLDICLQFEVNVCIPGSE